jgi:hypothetical protein
MIDRSPLRAFLKHVCRAVGLYASCRNFENKQRTWADVSFAQSLTVLDVKLQGRRPCSFSKARLVSRLGSAVFGATAESAMKSSLTACRETAVGADFHDTFEARKSPLRSRFPLTSMNVSSAVMISLTEMSAQATRRVLRPHTAIAEKTDGRQFLRARCCLCLQASNGIARLHIHRRDARGTEM